VHISCSPATCLTSCVCSFMGQLTLARFRGDTTFGLVARIISTFAGGLTGAAIWHISTGAARGNPYGLSVTCAVAFPFFFFGRLYWPGPPVPNMIFFTTTALVSINPRQSASALTAAPILGNRLFVAEYSLPHWGVFVLWDKPCLGRWPPVWPSTSLTMSALVIEAVCSRVCRGIICVVSSIVTFRRPHQSSPFCSIFSFLPPSTTLRGYQRQSLATTASEIGTVYCSIVSYATSSHTEDSQNVIQNLIAIRLKLKRSIVLRANIIYEVGGDLDGWKPPCLMGLPHSFRCVADGPRKDTRRSWKFNCASDLLSTKIVIFCSRVISSEIAYLLSHLMSVLQHLEPAWTRAFLRRTRFLDPDFQGDILAVISKRSTDSCLSAPLTCAISV
jgi:hypothetical protein